MALTSGGRAARERKLRRSLLLLESLVLGEDSTSIIAAVSWCCQLVVSLISASQANWLLSCGGWLWLWLGDE
jgi:hypothetical protein